MTSCFEDSDLDLNDQGYNVAGFENTTTTLPAIADGEEYDFEIKVKLIGPTVTEVTNDITFDVVVTEGTTAVEGTHFRIDDPSVTLTKANDYLGTVTVTMLTEGIETPLETLPVLRLGTANVSGDDNVVETGKPVRITLAYACPSFLAGTYDVVTTQDASGNSATWTEDIIETGIGEYLTTHVGLWGVLNAEFGIIFTDVCDVITVPQHNLADTYSNQVYSHKPGFVDPETGVITIYYTIEPIDSWGTYTAVYTPAK